MKKIINNKNGHTSTILIFIITLSMMIWIKSLEKKMINLSQQTDNDLIEFENEQILDGFLESIIKKRSWTPFCTAFKKSVGNDKFFDDIYEGNKVQLECIHLSDKTGYYLDAQIKRKKIETRKSLILFIKKPIGQFISLSGEISRVTSEGHSAQKENSLIFETDSFLSSNDSYSQIQLIDSSQILIGENTQFEIIHSSFDNKTFFNFDLKVKKGSLILNFRSECERKLQTPFFTTSFKNKSLDYIYNPNLEDSYLYTTHSETFIKENNNGFESEINRQFLYTRNVLDDVVFTHIIKFSPEDLEKFDPRGPLQQKDFDHITHFISNYIQ